MTTSLMTAPGEIKKAPETTACRTCTKVASRVGAQDGLDVYVCADEHLTRYPIGRPHPPYPFCRTVHRCIYGRCEGNPSCNG